jgi:hypothetical protein
VTHASPLPPFGIAGYSRHPCHWEPGCRDLRWNVTNPSIAYRIEYSPNEGEIVEFDGSGGVHHSRYGWDVTYTSPNYTINGDTLTMELAYVAEVSTTRLVLTLGGISGDYDGDGDQEAAVQVLTYQRGKD